MRGLIIRILGVLAAALIAGHSSAQAEYKEVRLQGTELYSELFLLEELDLATLETGRDHFDAASRKINAFYHKQGYILAICYLVKETDTHLVLHVDEGKLGRIVFQRLNTLDTIRVRYDFRLPFRLYNKYTVQDRINRLKKKYGFKNIQAVLKPTRSYERAFFQIDQKIGIPIVGGVQLPFFRDFDYRYDLDINIVRTPSAVSGGAAVSYGFDINYTKGLIPYAKYRHPSLITEGDRLEAGTSMGIYYGLDLDFAAIPRYTFIEVETRYRFTPTLGGYFTPLIKGKGHNSRASRADLGLSEYNFTILRATADPGVTLLKKLSMYAGYGAEKAFVFDSTVDESAPRPVEVNKETQFWNIAEGSIVLDFLPFAEDDIIQRKFNLSYSHYFESTGIHRQRFNEFLFDGRLDIDLPNLDIFAFRFDYARLTGDVPFYHDRAVSGRSFKGFMGKGYYSHEIARVSNGYMMSFYREFFYAGVYVDGVHFKGYGHNFNNDLKGDQYGLASGLAGHFIVFDQFEFNISYGPDYLYSDKSSQMNLSFDLRKKW
ncbi:MAG TPA: hypothetical protein VLM75_12595 [Spirochaetota bacterium]|nr:hypothetical protein [Spirochaetota bacterium]